jgi:diaminohydroxyphosphoribosylaminopyrimidine deaminase/5-amino-6-(5-phosphoribosylamino)uracil reductase
MEEVGQRGIHHALLEGGPTLAGAFLRAGLVDEVIVYLAPALLGAGSSAIGDIGIDSIADVLRLDISEVVLVGSDVRITAMTTARIPEGA